MESTQGASSDQSSSSNNNNTPATNATTKQTTPETKTNILCQTKSVSTIHTQQPVAMLHFRELENQLKAERAQAQRSFEKGPKMIPIDMVPMQRASSDEDSLDDAKNYRLPIGIRKMNEKARKFNIFLDLFEHILRHLFRLLVYILIHICLVWRIYLIRCREVGKTTGINKIKSRTIKEYARRCETF